MNCPDEPSNTCPLIDKVIEGLHLPPYSADRAADMEALLEEIREANADLRERAQFFEQQAGEFEEKFDECRTERDAARAELFGLTAVLARHLERIAEKEAELVKIRSCVCTRIPSKNWHLDECPAREERR